MVELAWRVLKLDLGPTQRGGIIQPTLVRGGNGLL